MSLLENLDRKDSLFWMIAGCLFVAGIGVVDFLSGIELVVSLFYLIPIVLVTWFAGRNLGLVISVMAAITGYIADEEIYSFDIIGYWNASIRLGFFVVITLLLPVLKALEHEKAIARIDYLTGIANRRHFFEMAQAELFRSQRYECPFTIAYLDLDGFKGVNDEYGHQTGDDLLCAFVNRAKSCLRKSDIMARLGGDEFVFLFPEIDQEAAKVTVPRIQSALGDEMQKHGWLVTFSIGVLTYQKGEISADALIKRADDLMYSIKNNGKNSVAYASFSG
jgi:diguanylate cyclase (GGDEF)-like protein